MSVVGWIELLLLISVTACLAALLSPLLYKYIVKQQGSVVSYVVCYVVVIPVLLLSPYPTFQILNIRNHIFRFCLGILLPITCLFKTTAVTHGFCPDYAKTSKKAFAYFYACPMLMERDHKLDKFVPATISDLLSNLKVFLVGLLHTGILITFFQFIPEIIPPLATGPLPPDSDWYDWKPLLDPRKWWLRNLLFGIFFQCLLTVFGEGMRLAQSLVTGYKTNILMDNPILSARSPSQFWGSKWNLVIHDVLKIGVYLPLRKQVSKPLAMLGTFVASGLFHEALLWIFLYPLDDAHRCFSDPVATATKVECYKPRLFTTTIFFMHQAFLVGIEYSRIGQLAIWKKVPDVLATLSTVTLGAVFGHFFVEPYWNSLGLESCMILINLVRPDKGAHI